MILGAALLAVYQGKFVTKGYVDRVITMMQAQIDDRAQQIADLKAANATLQGKVDNALDTLDKAIDMIEAGPQLPTTNTRRGQSGTK